MINLRFVICSILLTTTTGVFAGTTQVKYEGHYSIEKSSQVKHLSISQKDFIESLPANA